MDRVRFPLAWDFTSLRLGLGEVSFFSLIVVFVIGLFRLDVDILPGCTFVALARTEPELGVVMVPTANLPVSQLEFDYDVTDRIAIMLHQDIKELIERPHDMLGLEPPVPNDTLTNPIRML